MPPTPRFETVSLQIVHGVQQVRQRAAEAIQLPNDETVARLEERQRFGETGAILSAAAGMVLEQVRRIHAGRQQRVTLEVQKLAVAGADSGSSARRCMGSPEAPVSDPPPPPLLPAYRDPPG
jgi:hypothetical protein